MVEMAGSNDYTEDMADNVKTVVAIPVWHHGLLDFSEDRRKVFHG